MLFFLSGIYKISKNRSNNIIIIVFIIIIIIIVVNLKCFVLDEKLFALYNSRAEQGTYIYTQKHLKKSKKKVRKKKKEKAREKKTH